MQISRPSVGVVIAVLLSSNAIAGAFEDCAAAYDRQDYATALQLFGLLLSMTVPSPIDGFYAAFLPSSEY